MNHFFKSRHSWATEHVRSSGSFLKRLFGFFARNKKARRTFIKNILLAGIACCLFGAIFFLGMFAWLSRDLPDPNSLTLRDIAQSTKIYDRTGEHLLYEISGDEKRTLVQINDIPSYVVQATITAEDRKFYEHGGIDFKGMARAMLRNIINFDLTGQSGSTITQQLVKNAILTGEKSYIRKIKEVVLAIALERRYTKDEIMQLYLNEIPYGSMNYGIESAAQAYFGKHISDVTLAEAATLASLPNRPSVLLNNPDTLLSRRNWILDGMFELGYITQEELDAALAEDTPVRVNISNMVAPHFVLWVKEQLVEKFGEVEVEQGGLRVITTLDYDKQIAAEKAVKDNVDARGSSYNFNNAGLVAIDPNTGEILAMVGSVDYFNDEIQGQVNVTMRPLQPGSSFKPIVYAAAFEKGYTPNTILWDVDTQFPTSTGMYHPQNYSANENGAVTVRKALQGSLNIPAVKMLYLVGVQNALDFAERLGYSTFGDRSNFGLAIVLGGAEVLLTDHVNAFATFANGGTLHEEVSILNVQDSDENVLYENKLEDPGKQVLEANIANMVSNVLSDNEARTYIFGANNYLTLGSRPAAAKTGTTNDYKDAWTVGYTPSLAAGVWVGNTNGTAMKRGADGSVVAAPIWNQFMREALAGTAVEYFPSPSIPITGKAILDGQMPSTTVVIDTASGKLATEATPDRFKKTVMCGEYHDTLYYVSRGNPLGPVPTNPENDQYFDEWESAVQAYLVRHNANLKPGEVAMETCDVPTEYDDVHVPANEPSINIKNPDDGDSVGRTFTIQINASAPRGVSRIEYLVDDQYVKTSEGSSGTTLTLPTWVGTGSHTLSAVAYDDIDNSKKDSININVTETGVGSLFSISNPFQGQTIEKTQPSYLVVVEGPTLGSFSDLYLVLTNAVTGQTFNLLADDEPENLNTVEWMLPEAGSYILTARATQSGITVDSEPIRVLVTDPATPAL
ncbi:MAG: penicillin-binding protein [Patescibacteria group bacterium]